VRKLAAAIAAKIGADAALADRAALLAKSDLATNMVGEFPELQGIMGRYYALADGEHASVAEAIGDQYRIRYDDAARLDNLVSVSLFVADRIETLVGIWGIGLQPTGEKDPFGLRRAALGLISAFERLGATLRVMKQPFNLQLDELLQQAATLFAPGTLGENTTPAIVEFVYERYRNQMLPLYDRNAVDAVIALMPPMNEVVARVQAVVEFGKLPEAGPLAAANKRIGNILKKAAAGATSVDSSLLAEEAEKTLAKAVSAMRPDVQARFAAGDYAGTLQVLAQSKDAVDSFFNEVMVMADDAKLRDNRIALLRDLHGLMNQVADISRLAA
jgi:glycyl-tRNA synthetase beta chain